MADTRVALGLPEAQELVRTTPLKYAVPDLYYKLVPETVEIQDLTPGQQLLTRVATFDGEVCNGGVEQFLWNQPEYIDDVLADLRVLGLDELAAGFESVLDDLAGEGTHWIDLRTRFDKTPDLTLFVESRKLVRGDWFNGKYYGEWDGYGTKLADGWGDDLARAVVAYVTTRIMDFVADA